jgi:hypothetical protein
VKGAIGAHNLTRSEVIEAQPIGHLSQLDGKAFKLSFVTTKLSVEINGKLKNMNTRFLFVMTASVV